MRVGIQTWGVEGDIRPFIALAEGLANAGHTVAMQYSAIDDRDYFDGRPQPGFSHRRIGSLGLTSDQLRTLAAPIFGDPNPIRQLGSIVREFLAPFAPALIGGAVDLAASSDVIVHNLFMVSAAAAAEKYQKPAVAIHLQPSTPTQEFAAPGMPELGPRNRVGWQKATALANQCMLPLLNTARAAMALPSIAHVSDQVGRSVLDLVAVSPSLVARPSDWPAKVRATGALHSSPARSNETTPEGLEEFLAERPAPVFVTFGSMLAAEKDPAALFTLIVEAIDAVGCRAIVQTGSSVRASMLPRHPRILWIARAPHDAVFPRCAAIVHHGGAGTTQTAISAGRPSVIVAYITDQFFWGRIAFERGVAPSPLDRTSVRASSLAAAIHDALTDTQLANAANALGRRMREEDGVGVAVKLIEGVVAGGS